MSVTLCISKLHFDRYNKISDPIRCCPNQPIQNAVYETGNKNTCNFVCNPGYMWSDTSLSCVFCPSISPNSTFTRGCESACKFGYAGNPCISCSDYLGTAVLPPGGVWNMSTCGLSCLSGYRLFSNKLCCPLQTPAFAQVWNAPAQCNFKCIQGYRWDSQTLMCSACPNYVHRNLNNTEWGFNCDYECTNDSSVPPDGEYFECLTCPDCKTRCLSPQHPVPADASTVVWTFNRSLSSSAKCQWSCPSSMPQPSGTRCCNSLSSTNYRFVAPGSCSVTCSPGFDSLSNPSNTQFALTCVPCSMSYRASQVPVNAIWSDKAPSSDVGNCQYVCKSGFTMYKSNGTDLCCQLPNLAVLSSGAQSCNDWVCPSNTYMSNQQCFNISAMVAVCRKSYFCSQCLATAGCGWCDSSQSCLPGVAEGTTLPSFSCSKWKFGSCADDCVGRSCETCTNAANDVSVKCSWCASTSECIRTQTAGKSCSSENSFSALETCVTSCSSYTDCSSCASSSGCTYCSAKSTCLSNMQYSFLSENSRRYNYFCDKIYGKSLPGSCPSSADSMYLILIVALGALSCGCFLWFLCSRSNMIRAICNCCSFSNQRRDLVNPVRDQEMGDIIPYNGSGLDPNILQTFPLIKYQQKKDPNIKFQEDGLVSSHLSVISNYVSLTSFLESIPLVLYVLANLKSVTTSGFCRAHIHFIRVVS